MSVDAMGCVSMREFLRSGDFGPVRLGDSVDVLRAAFGDPDDTGGTSRRQKTPVIWKYGDVEFHLTADASRVGLIFCDRFERLHLGAAASFDPWFFAGHPSVETVERELATAGIPCHRQDAPYEPTARLLRLDSGIELLFSRQSDPAIGLPAPGLIGFQYARRNARG